MTKEGGIINGEITTIVWKDFIESPAGIVLNGIMNTVPGFNGAWVALQQAIEQGKNMRILRAIDLLELFSNDDFQNQFLESEQAVDGFLLCYEAIIRERNEKKRKTIKNIFLGFTKLSEEEKENYELERILDTLTKLEPKYLEILKETNINHDYGLMIKENGIYVHQYDFMFPYLEGLGLIHIGRYITKTEGIDFGEEPIENTLNEEVIMSEFGQKFIQYITD